jgi:hypothetical protein
MPAIEIELPECHTDEDLRKEQERVEKETELFEAKLDAAYERAKAASDHVLSPRSFALGFIAGYEQSR